METSEAYTFLEPASSVDEKSCCLMSASDASFVRPVLCLRQPCRSVAVPIWVLWGLLYVAGVTLVINAWALDSNLPVSPWLLPAAHHS